MNTAIKSEQLTTVLGTDDLNIWVDVWLNAKRTESLSSRSIDSYSFTMKKFLRYCDAQSVKNIGQITVQLLRDFLFLLESEGHNVGGISVYYKSIKAFLNWFEFEEEPEGWKNPIRKIKSQKNKAEPIQGITLQEFDLLVSVCRKNTFNGVRDMSILYVLLDSGIRAQELIDIKLNNVNLIEGSIYIESGKGKKPRTVYVGINAKKQLRRYLKIRGNEGKNLFVNSVDKQPLVYEGLRQIILRLCRKAGIKGIGLHDFRRAFCVNAISKGIDLVSLARLMGHGDLHLLMRYSRQSKDDLSKAYKSIIDD